MRTGLHCLLVGGSGMCKRPGMACSVTEARSHDESRGGRSVTGVHGSVRPVYTADFSTG